MIYLLLSVLCSVGIFVSFKIGRQLNISVLALITINYYVALVFGSAQLLSAQNTFPQSLISSSAIILTISVGVLFVIMFYIASRSVEQAGISISSAASKLSVVFPFFFSLFIDPSDKFSSVKIAAIIIILISIILISYKKRAIASKLSASFYPIVLFLGMGFVDSLVKYSQHVFIFSDMEGYFSTGVFFFSAIAATVWFLGRGNRFRQINTNTILLGVGLGMSNFGSLFFFIKALNSGGYSNLFGSSSIFALNNVSIIVVTSIVGLLLFRERLALINLGGILLSLVGIILLLY